MRNILIFCLALALVLGGEIALSHESLFTVPKNEIVEKVANITPVASIDSNGVEVDGIRFETVIPERVWRIPENKPGATTPVPLGISVTNNTSTPLYFSFYSDMLPDLVGSDGQSLLAGGGFEGISYPIESDFVLAMPGERVTYLREAKLFWNDNQLLLGSHNSRVNLRLGTWFYQDLKPGSYYVRFKYRNRESQATYYKPETKQYIRLEAIWTGQVIIPFVEIRLVMP
ncbi:hypothetical protein [Argonema antarcticum]|uniref:hypothetical protein n=1 Tax=Argonema antarcticum TaxID=2942763 RepID=UPI0020114F99|nr:hypothetical protein [Argonema antarcticum]MCL1475564.1 hypothetical protein [Argonema antarcticum A004/B2]